MIERALRWTAIAIAALAFIDPQLTVTASARPRISVMRTGGAAAETAQGAVRRELVRDFDVVDGLDRSADAIVVVGDRYPSESFDSNAKISTVTLDGTAPRVAIVNVTAPRAVPPVTTVRLSVEVAGNRARGETSTLIVRSGGARVAQLSHTWTADAERWHPEADVVPVGEGPFVFEIRVDEIDTKVVVDAAPRLRVLVTEARPSWASSFVRRALEEDPRFEVSGVLAASPGTMVRSGPAPEWPADLRDFDAVIVGGFDRLSSAQLALLERFARERGGTAILVPDAALPSGAAQRLIPGVILHETLLEQPARLAAPAMPSIQASELLEASRLPSSTTVLARASSSNDAVVWSMPSGDGRILVCGAMDAWRFRSDTDNLYDRFWQSAAAGAALAARPAIDVTLVPERAAPGERVQVVARIRSLEQHRLGERLAIAARLDDQPIRLWPDAASGVFSGSFVVPSASGDAIHRVTATLADGSSGSAPFVIDAKPSPSLGPPLGWLARSHGGVDVNASQMGELARHFRRALTPSSIRAQRHPMRTPWWVVPFAVCLSGEWWLRRQRGAR
jgi:hypothetical protein